jgi:hypothetical protein
MTAIEKFNYLSDRSDAALVLITVEFNTWILQAGIHFTILEE